MNTETVKDMDVISVPAKEPTSIGSHYAILGLSVILSLFILSFTFSDSHKLLSASYILLMVQGFLHVGFLCYLGVKCWSYYRLSQNHPFLNRTVSLLPFVMVFLSLGYFIASPLFLTIGYLIVLYSYFVSIKYSLSFHPDSDADKASYRTVIIMMTLTYWISSVAFRLVAYDII